MEFNEELDLKVKSIVRKFFKEEFSNEFGYVSTKLKELDSIQDLECNVSLNKIHPVAKNHLISLMPEETKTYLKNRYGYLQ